MTHSLTEMDPVYASLTHDLRTGERIAYCEKLIDRTQAVLLKNQRLLSEEIRERSQRIILAAQNELRNLTRNMVLH